jgi:hypothetical protein
MSDPNQYVFESFTVPVQLDTQEKLRALQDDPSAGFLPFSHLEKSTATEMLDYLGDRRRYPAGLGNRLQEIYLRNRRDIGDAEARRAMFSLAYVYGDFALNAAQQHAYLSRLEEELRDDHFNPGVTIADDFPDGHAGLAAVVRFVDVRSVRDEAHQRTTYDPLKVSQRRTIAAQSGDAAAHKQVGDRYTVDEQPAEVEQRILTFLEQTRVAELRALVPEVQANEARRLAFWTERLRDTRKHGAAWIIGKDLLAQLEQIEPPTAQMG